MALSEAYGAKPDFTILTYEEHRKGIEMMSENDKKVFRLTIRQDADMEALESFVATIKNLPSTQNASTNELVSS